MDTNVQGVTHPSITNRAEQNLNGKPASGLQVNGSPAGDLQTANLAQSAETKADLLEQVQLAKAVTEPEGVAKGAAKNEQQDAEALAEIVEQLSDVMTMMNKGLAFSVDEDLGTAVVKVMDIDSGEIIRQIPSDEALELAQKLQDVKGLLMKTEA